VPLGIIIIIIIIIIKMSFIKVALSHCCCRGHLTMLPCRVKQQKMIVKTGKFSVPAEMRRSTKQPGLAAAESAKPELQPRKRAIADRCATCRWNKQSKFGGRAELSSRSWTNAFAQVLRRRAAETAFTTSKFTHSRNWIHSKTLSQCSSWSSGVSRSVRWEDQPLRGI